MSAFTPLSAAAGGLLIGLSASAMLSLNGRITGISGVVGGIVLPEEGDRSWRTLFVLGLLTGGVVMLLLHPSAFEAARSSSILLPVGAGVLVGLGTKIGNGCTSGHGVCGIGRLSPRSIAATMIFMGTAMLTTYVARHVIGGGP